MGDSSEHQDTLLKFGDYTVDLDQREVRSAEKVDALTPLETNLLSYLAQRPNEVISKRELLVEVWGYHANTRTRAPSLLISRLRRKLGDDLDNPRFLRTIRGTGYQLHGLPARSPTPAAEAPSAPSAPAPATAPEQFVDLPDPSLPISAAEARRLRRLRPTLEAHPREDSSPHAIRARLLVAWSALMCGEKPDVERLWRDAEKTNHPGLRRLCAVMALRSVEATGTRPAVLRAAKRVEQLLDTDGIDDETARCMVALIQCTAFARLGELDEARAKADQASVLGEQTGKPKLRALVSDRLAFLDRRAHRFNRALQHARDAIELLDDCECLQTRVEVSNNMATLHYVRGELDDARTQYEAALESARKLGASAAIATIRASLVSVCLNLGDLDGASDHYHALLDTEVSGDRRRHNLLECYHGARIQITGGKLEEATGSLERAVHLATRTGEYRLSGYAHLLQAWISLMASRLDEAAETLEDLGDRVEEIGDLELQGAHALLSMWAAQLASETAQVGHFREQAQQLLKAARSPLAVFLGGRARPGQEWLRRQCDRLIERHPILQTDDTRPV